MLAKFWYTVLVCYLSILGFFSLNPWIKPASTDSAFSPDKLDHAIAYGGLAIITFFCLTKPSCKYTNNISRAWIASLIIAVLIGILIEIAQGLFTYNRTGSTEDAVANAIGALLGYVAYQGAIYIVKLASSEK